MREALVHPYGRAYLAEFAKVVAKNADTTCLQSKGLDAVKLSERGRDIFQHYGTNGFELLIKSFDKRKFEAKLAVLAGKNAMAEFYRLRNNTDVKAYLHIERPARLAKVLNATVETFDQYVMLTQIRLTNLSPVATGNRELEQADPTEKASEALDQFMARTKSREFKRFAELSDIIGEALAEGVVTEFALKAGPKTYFGGVEKNLAALCIGQK